MNKIIIVFVCSLFALCVSSYSGYCEDGPACNQTVAVAKAIDKNKDGKPDVIYYTDGENVTKVEADTNYDGKTDVTVHVKNGKFDSAESDADYNGTPETKFTDTAGFNAWLNANHPDFNKELVKQDWRVKALEF